MDLQTIFRRILSRSNIIQKQVRLKDGTLLGVVAHTDNVSWAVFRQAEGPASLGLPVCSPGFNALTLEEKTYANTLLDSVTHSRSNISSTPMSSRHTEALTTQSNDKNKTNSVSKKESKFKLIKNLKTDTYADLTVHVVKTWYQDNRVHLYVTDYTTNKSLFDYQDKSDDENGGTAGDELGYLTRITREKRSWSGPKGRMTLQVTLWDPHASYARDNVSEDTYVALSNVRVKLDKMNGMMEGVIHTDQMYPNKVNIRVIEPDSGDFIFTELKDRKREYWRQNKKNKRKLAEDFGEDGGVKKNAKKRRKEQQRLKKQQEHQQQQQQQKPPPRKEEGQTEIPVTMHRSHIPNPYSMCFLPLTPTLAPTCSIALLPNFLITNIACTK